MCLLHSTTLLRSIYLVFVLLLLKTVDSNEIEVNHVYHESGDVWTEVKHQPTIVNNRFYGIAQRTLSTGHTILLDYDFGVRENSVFLDDIDGISPYNCSHNSFIVKLENNKLQNLFVVGGFLIGKTGTWGCVDDNGKQRNVLQQILSIYFDPNTQLLSMYVRWVNHLEVVQPNSRVSIKILPGNCMEGNWTNVQELHHASEVKTIYLGKNGTKRNNIQKRNQSPTVNHKWPFSFSKQIGPISLSCPNCYFQVSIGFDYGLSVDWGVLTSAHVGVISTIQGNFVVVANADAGGSWDYEIVPKFVLVSINVVLGIFPINIDPYVQIESKFSWSLSATASAGFTIPTNTWTRGIQYSKQGVTPYSNNPPQGFSSLLQWVDPISTFTGQGSATVILEPRFGLSLYGTVDLFAELPLKFSLSALLNSRCLQIGVAWDISIACGIGKLKIGPYTIFNEQLFGSTSIASGTLDSSSCTICGTCVAPTAPSSSKKRMILQDDDDTFDIPCYFTGNWTDCSDACTPGGELTYRNVTCMIGSSEVDPSYCGGTDPPPSVAYCDTTLCSTCSAFTSCDSCIASPCYWCPKSNICNVSCTNPADNGGDYYFCSVVEEAQIIVSSCNTDGPLPWTVDWTGGYNDGNGTIGGANIYVVDNNENVWSQFGVPVSISSTQNTIYWQPNGIADGNYTILLVSSTDDDNYDFCDVTVTTQSGSTTVVSSWSPCNEQGVVYKRTLSGGRSKFPIHPSSRE